jgi:hypothetical protein
MSSGRLIIFVLIFTVIGYVFYKVKPWDFSDNSKFILNVLFDELKEINKTLKKNGLIDAEKRILVARKDEIYYILEQFFGKNLKEEENGLV